MHQAVTDDPSVDLYTARFLRYYDAIVLGLSNRVVWRCPTRELLDHYQRHLGSTHLDIGPGTGWFLAHVHPPGPSFALTLLDPSDSVLGYAGRRLRHLRPQLIKADLRDKLELPAGTYESIGLNYVLHCVPEPFAVKAQMLAALRRLLAPAGVLFGSTILATGVQHTRFSRAVQASYNRRGWFGNAADSLAELDDALASGYARHEITIRGAAALFTAWND